MRVHRATLFENRRYNLQTTTVGWKPGPTVTPTPTAWDPQP